MRNILRDVRQGVRLLARAPGFTAVAVLTLALGIGANTAIFTVTYAILLKPLPYSNPDEIVLVTENNLSRGWPSFSVSPANFLDWRAQNHVVLHARGLWQPLVQLLRRRRRRSGCGARGHRRIPRDSGRHADHGRGFRPRTSQPARIRS